MASVALPGTRGIGGTGYEALHDRFHQDAARGVAVNPGLRPAGATPFRSLGKISIRPRTYQFVPLLMALRLDPVRLLIADDVGNTVWRVTADSH